MNARQLTAVFLLALMPALHSDGGVQAAGPGREQVSLERAVEKVRQRTGGRVLSADTEDEGRRHRVRVLDGQGHVREFHIDTRDGRIRDARD